MSAIASCLALHIMLHMVVKVDEVSQCSEQMLNELEKDYSAVFSEPTYPIWEYQQLF